MRELRRTILQNGSGSLLEPEQVEKNCRFARFSVGPEGGTEVSIGALDCSLVLKAKVAPGATTPLFPEIRSWVEDGILAIHPNLDCQVYVCPCTTGSGKDWLTTNVCTQESTKIGSLHEVHGIGTNKTHKGNLRFLRCLQHRTYLNPKRYKHWFGFQYVHRPASFKNDVEKSLLNLAKKISKKWILLDIALQLGLPETEIETELTNYPGEFTQAAFKILQKWHQRQGHQGFDFERCDMLANAFAKVGLDQDKQTSKILE